MTTYTKATNFATKDALLTGNPSKVVKGTEIDAEFTAIQAADATSLKSGGALGTPSSGTLTNCTGLPSTGFTFLQAGTGATTRTGQAKLRDTVNAKDFGVAADGSTNDAAALQLAVDYLVANGGGILQLPPGFISVGSAISITKGIAVIGAGAGAGGGAGNSGGTVVRSSAAGGNVFSVSGVEPCLFENFRIDAPSVTKSAGTAGISLTGGNRRSRIKNVTILNQYYGVLTDWAGECLIEGCQIQDFLSVGVYWKQTGGTDSGHNTISNCVIWDLNVGTSVACVQYDQGGDVRIIGNKLLAGQYAIYVNLTTGPTGTMLVSGNSIEQQTVRCMEIAQSVAGSDWGNLVVTGNQFSVISPPTATGGVRISAGTSGGAYRWVRNINISNNVFNFANAGSEALILANDGEAILINGNVLDLNNIAGHVGIEVGSNVASGYVIDNIINRYSTGKYGTISSKVILRDSAAYQTSTSLGDAYAHRASADSTGFALALRKTRGATQDVQTVVQNNDAIGSLVWEGSDGTGYIQGALIKAAVDGTPGTNDMPGRLIFSTTADGASSPTEAMRIDSTQSIYNNAAGSGTNAYGFNVSSAKTGATNNYGFYSAIASAANRYNLYMAGTADNYFAGKMGISAAASSNGTLAVSTNSALLSGTDCWTILAQGASPTSSTSTFRLFYALGGASAAGVNTLSQFYASQGTLSGTVTSQIGYQAASTLTGATNNYGFYSDIASAANRYNFYANGTAQNYFAGATSIGTSSMTSGAVFEVRDATDGTNFIVGGSGTTNLLKVASGSADAMGLFTNSTTEVLRLQTAGGSTLAPNAAIPAGGTAGIGYMVSSTANFGVFFGSGAPTLSAAKGSLYLRSDGSTTNDRMYVNTNGSTTWTAVTTAA